MRHISAKLYRGSLRLLTPSVQLQVVRHDVDEGVVTDEMVHYKEDRAACWSSNDNRAKQRCLSYVEVASQQEPDFKEFVVIEDRRRFKPLGVKLGVPVDDLYRLVQTFRYDCASQDIVRCNRCL